MATDLNSKQALHEIVARASELEQTMKTPGWVNVVQPLLDKMIMDTIGFKREDGTWNTGCISHYDKPSEEIAKLFAYRQGLIEFNNRVLSHLLAATKAIKILNAKEETKGYIRPMSETRYGSHEGDSNG